MEKNVEETVMKKDRQIEQLKAQMVATASQFQQKLNDRVTEGMRDREKELRTKYVTPLPSFVQMLFLVPSLRSLDVHLHVRKLSELH